MSFRARFRKLKGNLTIFYFIMKEKLHRVLVVDDDTRLRNLLGKYLNDNHFYVASAKDTAEAKTILTNDKFDILVVDVMMPGENGIELTKWVKNHCKTPVLILTARGEIDERIHGLEAGADDYMPKPFEPKELLLRINNILKRTSGTQSPATVDNLCQFGDFIFNLNDSRLKKHDEHIHVTESEAKILAILCQELGKTVSREKLSELCGGIDDRSIDVQITRLRRKIENNPKQPEFLQTVRNQGYVLHN